MSILVAGDGPVARALAASFEAKGRPVARWSRATVEKPSPATWFEALGFKLQIQPLSKYSMLVRLKASAPHWSLVLLTSILPLRMSYWPSGG